MVHILPTFPVVSLSARLKKKRKRKYTRRFHFIWKVFFWKGCLFRSRKVSRSMSFFLKRRRKKIWDFIKKGRFSMNYSSFNIVIEKEQDDEGYYACSPTLPGCFSNGATIEAARHNIRVAIEQHLEALVIHDAGFSIEDYLHG